MSFTESWALAATTSAAYFWKALWAFVLGYVMSGAIQVFMTRRRMRETMGESGPRSLALGTFFGFVSSSCSFAALSTTRALFAKGAGLSPAVAFLLASTNLVIELGVVIAIFLSWQFVVGEYVAGLLLVGLVASSLLLHAGFAFTGSLPDRAAAVASTSDGGAFAVDATLFLNLAALGVCGVMWWLARAGHEPAVIPRPANVHAVRGSSPTRQPSRRFSAAFRSPVR